MPWSPSSSPPSAASRPSSGASRTRRSSSSHSGSSSGSTPRSSCGHGFRPSIAPSGSASLGCGRVGRPSSPSFSPRPSFALALAWTKETRRRQDLSEEAIALAEEGGDRACLAEALCARHGTLFEPASFAERLSIVDRIGSLAAEAESQELALIYGMFRTTALLETGEIAAARGAVSRYRAIANRAGQTYALWYVEQFAAMLALLEGRFADAQRGAARILERGSCMHDGTLVQSHVTLETLVLRDLGRCAEVVDILSTAAEEMPEVGSLHSSVASMCVEAGRLDDARRWLARIVPTDLGDLPTNEIWGVTMATLSTAACGIGDVGLVRRLRARMQGCANRFMVIHLGAAIYASGAQCLGRLAAAAGDLPAALSHFERALDLERKVGARPASVRTAHAYAEALLSTGSKADARRARRLAGRGPRRRPRTRHAGSGGTARGPSGRRVVPGQADR